MTNKITFKKDKKGNIESVAIHGATFYYTNIRSPRPIFDDREMSYDKARKEYSVDVAVSEDVADEWDEVFAKQPSKKYTNVKFREKYKLEEEDALPFPDEKKQFTIKIVQKAQKNDGDPIPDGLIPRVFIVEDGKAKDITFSTNIGNGSTGAVQVRANINKYGQFAYLSKVKVEDLIEYEGNEGGISDEDREFLGADEVELAEAPERKATKATEERDDDDDDDTPTVKTAEKPAKKSAKVDDSVDDDDF